MVVPTAQKEDIEHRVMRKVGWRLVPFLMLLYFVAYLDRVNIGFAALTMNADLGLSSAAFGLGAGIFFIGYFLFEVPSNLILHKVGARRWIARIMASWGIVSVAMSLVQDETSFYVLRFLLGVAEAGFFPGIILYISLWFPARHRAGITALFMAAVPLSTAIGSPLSGALLTLDGWLGLKGWQWLFMLEGLPAIFLAGAVLSYLTDRPDEAAWLDPDEKRWLVAKMNAEAVRSSSAHDHSEVWRALRSPKILALALVYFGTSAGLYTLGIWSPLIIAQFESGPLIVGLLNAIPPTAAVIAMILWARHSDATNERVWHVAIACVTASAGLVLASQAHSMFAVILALTIVNIGISAAKPPLWIIPTQLFGGAAAAAAIAAVNAIGNLGGFAGPALIGWLKDASGAFEAGLLSVAALLGLSAAIILAMANRPSTQPFSENGEQNA